MENYCISEIVSRSDGGADWRVGSAGRLRNVRPAVGLICRRTGRVIVRYAGGPEALSPSPSPPAPGPLASRLLYWRLRAFLAVRSVGSTEDFLAQAKRPIRSTEGTRPALSEFIFA